MVARYKADRGYSAEIAAQANGHEVAYSFRVCVHVWPSWLVGRAVFSMLSREQDTARRRGSASMWDHATKF
jgi:hypothetical protein